MEGTLEWGMFGGGWIRCRVGIFTMRTRDEGGERGAPSTFRVRSSTMAMWQPLSGSAAPRGKATTAAVAAMG